MKYFIFIFLISISLITQAQEKCKLKGQVFDEKGNPVPYATLFVQKNAVSAMANAIGKFSLSTLCGSFDLKVQCLGYESKTLTIQLQTNKENFEIKLQSLAFQLEEVKIDPSSEDPAYNIIRKAIVMAQYYKNQVIAYETDLYIKSFYTVEDLPWLIKKMAEEDDIAEIEAGNVDETLLHYSFSKPNTVKEKIIAKKSGSNDTSKTGSSYINLNFYNLGGSDIINPLSRNSFKVYEFEYISTFFEENRKVHKIKIIPKRRGGDLMKGFLYINDGLWNLNNVDVVIDQQMFTVEYKQQYNEIRPMLWMPTNHKVNVKGGIIGIKATMQYLANLSKLSVTTDSIIDKKIKSTINKDIADFEKNTAHPTENKIEVKQSEVKQSKISQEIEALISKEKLNNRETFKLVRLIKKQEQEEKKQIDSTQSYELKRNYKLDYSDSAFSLSDSSWESKRSIPLAQEEKAIYSARDSLNKKQAIDTADKNDKSFFYQLLFTNKTITSKNKKHSFQPKGLLDGLIPYFNTVDGFAPEKKLFDYEWTNKNGKFIQAIPYLSYAVARKTFTGRLELSAQYNKRRRGSIHFTAGRRTVGFNRDDAISDRLNTIATTFFTGNFKKLYQQDFFTLNHSIDLINGLVFSTGLEFANRIAMENNSDYELFSFLDREFTPNIPINAVVFEQPELIGSNKAVTVTASLEYTPHQFYTYKNHKKELLNSTYPTFGIAYRKGIAGMLQSQSDYDVINFSVRQQFPFRLIDELSYFFEGGKFLTSESTFFADYQNFNTTPSFVIDNNKVNGFRLLDYYAFNTNNYYFEGHFSITNDHLFLKYLPLLNRTGVDEKLEFGYLYTDRNIHFYEAGLSLTNIFYLMDAGAFVSFRDNQFNSWAIKLSFYFFH